MIDESVHDCASCPLNAGTRCPLVHRKVKAGTTLWRQGDVPSEVVFVKEGLYSLSSTEPSGTESLTSVRGPRALLGTESLRGEATTATAEAITDGSVCVGEPSTLKAWMGPPSPAATMLSLVLDELSRQSRDLALRTGPALARVARFIVASAPLIEGGRRAPFSKQHVARLLGMRAETLSRCLRQLEDDGLITSGRSVVVKDEPRLQAVARGAA